MKRLMRGVAAAVAATLAMIGGNVAAQSTAGDKAALNSEREKVSYAIGLDIARSFEPLAPFVDLGTFEKAVRNAFAGGAPLQSEDEARATDSALRINLAASQGQTPPGMPPGSQPPAVDKAKVGLMLGDRMVGPSLLPLKDEIDLPLLIQAIRTAFAKGQPLLSAGEAQATMAAYLSRKQSEAGAKNRAEGAEFLAKNKMQKGVITTPSGLQYQVLRPGSGPHPTPNSTVRVNYEGKLLGGQVFDSSYKRGQPAEFPLTGVVAGWTEGIPLMPVGAKYRFWIPSELAYGPQGQPQGGIPPNATLTFDVELLGILQ
ncbi:FKBP-type peptidyl-prolyl cis-trans isomerase [Pseudoxanthomonas sangjuensis]|uniref:FKBP-type peptidyl-prolyl cis-trans isomerase n=1 Tax=Pseudoxanthomonas sangjuensis TaxID=1503750 RepID=UPI0013920333|nr:FKBP-type peptidyl-prolyl cis-trans isomerase [Pseudoxanthomonas sangjuensis]KAF1707897.1 peptidylprolyl isomerase [Pseudoxanthomonas sangjuensis]